MNKDENDNGTNLKLVLKDSKWQFISEDEIDQETIVWNVILIDTSFEEN